MNCMKAMKFFPLLFILIGVSCTEKSWSDEEQDKFVNECMGEGGGKVYCKCYMETTMKAYPHFQDTKRITFEEAVELSENCKH